MPELTEEQKHFKRLYEQDKTKLEQMQAEKAKIERAALIEQVKKKVQLPPTLYDRLQGESLEELLADAKHLRRQTKPEAEPTKKPKISRPGEVPFKADKAPTLYRFQVPGEVAW